MSESQRLDVWLWAARHYKTRALAVEAIKNGRVLVDEQRAKPAHPLRLGAKVWLSKDGIERWFRVEGLSTKRLGAALAQKLYTEPEDSITHAQAQREAQKMARALVDFPTRRPEKRERRQLRALRHHLEDS